jgi:hypothetical protein
MDGNKVNGRFAAAKSTHDVTVKALSSAASGSMSLFLLTAASQQFLAEFPLVRLPALYLPPQLCSFLFTLPEMSVYFLPMMQVVGNHGVHIGQLERWIGVDDALWICALGELVQHHIQRNARIADSKPSAAVFTKGQWIGL